MIEVKNVTKVFNQGRPNEMTALRDVSFEVGENELVILKGPSGSGKSTVLSLIAALQKPTSGEVIVEETRVSKLPDDFASLFRREKIGFIFQKFNLIPTLSVFDNIVTPLIPEKLSEKELEAKAERVMEEFSIAHKRDDLAKNLSGGEQQRVAIARALVNDPPIILADEPTANLDAKLAERFLEYVKRIKEEGKTILIATHDPLFFDLPITDREITLHNGRVV
ncbi:ABC transporter ATP-binding protein [Hydrogenimonas cancrithermarum]|uniref:ABC transporter ATP-binding protein n=1 Tax=Hydrogenimonas cancrithermarum TaxID=2993563 RepID=A0ABM8FJF8_9BACT|nr:ABC transporter ATP-binding protein [Hydrogenimonas cancrithermarum]BDY12424.1 ABC transporter ATP-binding protein [Hydrogenimonas cancrithermarum]